MDEAEGSNRGGATLPPFSPPCYAADRRAHSALFRRCCLSWFFLLSSLFPVFFVAVHQRLLPKSNIHFDKRVVRGNTYAAQITDPSLTLQSPSRTQKLKNQAQQHAINSAARRRLLGQPDVPVNGRTHMMVQTDDYLEELVDQIFEQDSGTQTEALEELPVPPIFMPKPVGEDVGTTIEEGELFDFELAVEPLLEVIVGKALEQSLMEVLEEEEISRLQRHREHFEQERNQILAETQRMEAHSLRHHQEKERRVQQERERLAREKEVAKKAAARTAAKHFMANLQSSVVTSLQAAGHLYDPVLKQVDGIFMPWLLESVAAKLSLVAVSRAETDSVILQAVTLAKKEVEDKRRRDEEARLAEEARVAAEVAEKLRVEEEARRLALEAEAARVEKEAADAAEALRKEREENGEEEEEGEDEEEEEDEEDV